MKLTNPESVGVDGKRLQRIPAAVAEDVARERYDGAVIAVGRKGKLLLHEAVGFTDRAKGRKAKVDDVFCVMSLTKSLCTAVILSYFEQGKFSLTTQVADIIPEFGAAAKTRITIAQLMAHTGGMSHNMPPLPVEEMGNLEAFVAAACKMPPEAPPGAEVSYSPLISQAILAEVVRRTDGGERRFSQILHDELFAPLGMTDTSLGQNPSLEDRRVPIVARGWTEGLMSAEFLESFNTLFKPGSEIPAVNAYSSVRDIYRFAEMLRLGGEIDGVRILSPLTIDFARRNHTGDKVNNIWTFVREHRGWDEWPAYLGLGFYLRGEALYPDHYGVLASPGTFGHAGVGSAVFWIDPVRDMVFVGLSAGLMEESYSMERWQKLSDIALSSIKN